MSLFSSSIEPCGLNWTRGDMQTDLGQSDGGSMEWRKRGGWVGKQCCPVAAEAGQPQRHLPIETDTLSKRTHAWPPVDGNGAGHTLVRTSTRSSLRLQMLHEWALKTDLVPTFLSVALSVPLCLIASGSFHLGRCPWLCSLSWRSVTCLGSPSDVFIAISQRLFHHTLLTTSHLRVPI